MSNYSLTENCKYPPKRAHLLDAGLDLFIQDDITIEPHGTVYAPAGVSFHLEPNQCVHVMTRSGTFKKGVWIIPTVIDANYQHEISTIVSNPSDEPITIHAGESFAQAILMQYGLFEQDVAHLLECFDKAEHVMRDESEKFGSSSKVHIKVKDKSTKKKASSPKPVKEPRYITIPVLLPEVAQKYSSSVQPVMERSIFGIRNAPYAYPEELKPKAFCLDAKSLVKMADGKTLEEVLSDPVLGHVNHQLLSTILQSFNVTITRGY